MSDVRTSVGKVCGGGGCLNIGGILLANWLREVYNEIHSILLVCFLFHSQHMTNHSTVLLSAGNFIYGVKDS